MAAPQDIEDEVFTKLGLLNLDELLNIHGELGLPAIEDDAQRTRGGVRGTIIRFLMSDQVVNSEDHGAAHYLVIKTFLDTQDIVVTRTTTADATPPPRPAAVDPPLLNNPAVDAVAPALNNANAGAGAPALNVNAVAPGIEPPVLQRVGGTPGLLNAGGAPAAAPPQTVLHGVKVKPEPDLDSSTASSASSVTSSDLRNLSKYLKKDFKIKGTIGLPGEKDRIKFSQLAHQINRGVKKGYSDDDICEEVLRITSPDIPLREMLDGRESMTVAELVKILRFHFHEKDSSKLWEELNKATQTASQDATQFTQTLISLKQRILFASKEAGSSVQFSESAVNKQFVRSLLSGLKNNNIRNELKAVVTVDMPDVDLLEHLDIAVANEEERLTKWGASDAMKKAVVNRVEVDSATDLSSSCSSGSCSNCHSSNSSSGGILKQPPRNDHNPILNKLGELQVSVNEVASFKNKLDNVDSKLGKVAQLEKELADLKKQVGSQKKVRFQWGCDACVAQGPAVARKCRHCFKCGGTDGHKKQDCPN